MTLPPDIPALLLSFERWGVCTIFLLFATKRFKGWKTYLGMGIAFFIFSGFHYLASLLPEEFLVPNIIGGLLLMFAYLWVMGKWPILQVANRSALAFLSAETAASLEWQLHVFFRNEYVFFQTYLGQGLVLLGVSACFLTVLFFVERRYMKMEPSYGWGDFIVQLFIATVVIALGNLSFWELDTPISGRYPTEILYIRTLVYFCGVLLLYTQRELKMIVQAKSEAALMQSMLEMQYEQFCLSKETIENINRKYHDLKHSIVAIRAETDPQKRAEYLDDIEQSIKTYEAQNKTGNPVLDVLLTTKSMLCLENKINFTCVVDGVAVAFMNVVDVCSLFGNALDNAIESVMKLPEEKRLIKLAVYSQNNFVLIQLANYYTNVLRYEGGQLITSKKDKSNHGFGVKSMKQIAEKYGGTLHITAENNWFSLSVILPILQTRTD